MAVTERKSASERRDEILEAALHEFAAHGLHGGSTEAFARFAAEQGREPVRLARGMALCRSDLTS